MIRLSDLTPEAVADEVVDWLRAHVTAVLFTAGCTSDVQVPGGSLRYEAAVLTTYAQTGELPPGEAASAGYVQTVVETLYRAPHPDVYSSVEGDWEGKDDPRRAIDAVIRATLARDWIAAGKRVPLAWLAVLVGFPVQTLRTYASKGEFRTAKDACITAREAREWLSARGVAGFRSQSN